MAKRFTGSKVNWSALTKVLVESDKPHFTTFKAKHDSYLRKVSALPEAPPKIDFAAYKAKLPNPALVDQFQKAYESLQIPYPADTETAKVNELEKKVLADIQKHIEESNVKITQLQQQLDDEKSLLPITEMTMQEVYLAYPELVPQYRTNPTFWPHDEENQITKEDEEWWEKRKKNLVGVEDH